MQHNLTLLKNLATWLRHEASVCVESLDPLVLVTRGGSTWTTMMTCFAPCICEIYFPLPQRYGLLLCSSSLAGPSPPYRHSHMLVNLALHNPLTITSLARVSITCQKECTPKNLTYTYYAINLLHIWSVNAQLNDKKTQNHAVRDAKRVCNHTGICNADMGFMPQSSLSDPGSLACLFCTFLQRGSGLHSGSPIGHFIYSFLGTSEDLSEVLRDCARKNRSRQKKTWSFWCRCKSITHNLRSPLNLGFRLGS